MNEFNKPIVFQMRRAFKFLDIKSLYRLNKAIFDFNESFHDIKIGIIENTGKKFTFYDQYDMIRIIFMLDYKYTGGIIPEDYHKTKYHDKMVIVNDYFKYQDSMRGRYFIRVEKRNIDFSGDFSYFMDKTKQDKITFLIFLRNIYQAIYPNDELESIIDISHNYIDFLS